MANIHKDWIRRIRITSPIGITKPYAVLLTDAQTGETIDNVQSLIFEADVQNSFTSVTLQYVEYSDEGKPVIENNALVRGQITLSDPIVDVTARE